VGRAGLHAVKDRNGQAKTNGPEDVIFELIAATIAFHYFTRSLKFVGEYALSCTLYVTYVNYSRNRIVTAGYKVRTVGSAGIVGGDRTKQAKPWVEISLRGFYPVFGALHPEISAPYL